MKLIWGEDGEVLQLYQQLWICLLESTKGWRLATISRQIMALNKPILSQRLFYSNSHKMRNLSEE